MGGKPENYSGAQIAFKVQRGEKGRPSVKIGGPESGGPKETLTKTAETSHMRMESVQTKNVEIALWAKENCKRGH